MVEFGYNERVKYGDIRGHFVIPAEIGGQSVTSIGPYVFAGCEELTGIEIPDSVITIGIGAFSACRGLISIEIPYGVISIFDRAFYGCDGLISILIPNTVISIGDCAFQYCIELISIELPNRLTSISDAVFAGCQRLSRIEIPHGVTSIGGSAFHDCIRLISIEISQSVISIGSHAFYGCRELSSIEIPNSVITIGGCAFEYCSGLETLKLSLPMRKLFPYKWVNALNLCCTFEYVFEFLSWQDLARMTKVSKYFYSNVMVRCRKDFMYNRIGESNIVIESNRPAELSIIGSAQCVSLFRRDELALYSSDCSEVRSVCVPPSFQEAAPAVVEERKK